MAFWSWSRTAGSNATADSTINWAEGQAPSSVNDSARGMMARTAEYRDDISGAIVTTGSSTAYAVTSYQVFDTLAHMNGQMIAFSPHATNGATVTLNVDGLGAKPLRSSPSVELPAGVLILGTPYVATYNNSDAVWYLRQFFGNPYNIPIGGCMPFFAPTAPNSSFVFPSGQDVSRTTYSAYFALAGTTFGAGNGSTTFTLPDLRGRVIATLDSLNGSDANRMTGSPTMTAVRVTLGGAGGAPQVTLTSAQMPSHTHSVTDPGHLHSMQVLANATFAVAVSQGLTNGGTTNTGSATTGISIQSTGGGALHENFQPTICANHILRII